MGKTLRKKLNWVLLCALLGLGFGSNSARAATIPILSGDGLSESNNITGTNVLINAWPEPIWKAPTKGGKWISYANTGVGGITAPDTAITGDPTAIFSKTFTIAFGQISVGGSLVSFWADDTAAVYIDSNPLSIFPLATTVSVGTYCLNSPVSCQPSKGGTVDLAGLSAGTHTLSIRAYQLFSNTFGILYEGAVITDAAPSAVPEPTAFVLGGFGATLMALLRRKNRA